ncbi:MAG: hypothetical protein JWM74_5614 [Myxococcaceae bacterium]|nr:hypothetical protein [Myxococcaceae bacterium]
MKMTTMGPLRLALVLASVISLALAGACSLNPQPIPPGIVDESDASTFGTSDSGRGGTGANDSDSSEPAAASDAAFDGAPVLSPDAGDSGDAGPDAADAADADGG